MDDNIQKNPIFSFPEKWVFAEAKLNQQLKVDRECELALQNYDLRRHNRDLENLITKLKSEISRNKTAIKDSSFLISDLQRKLNHQTKELNKSEILILSLKKDLSEADLSKKCLSSREELSKMGGYLRRKSLIKHTQGDTKCKNCKDL